MSVESGRWSVRVTATAAGDVQGILRWTAARFGARQARVYQKILSESLAELKDGPSAVGVRARGEIGEGLFTRHVAQRGRKGRHLILFRVSPSSHRTIDVIRVLHDAMDVARHLPAESGD